LPARRGAALRLATFLGLVKGRTLLSSPRQAIPTHPYKGKESVKKYTRRKFQSSTDQGWWPIRRICLRGRCLRRGQGCGGPRGRHRPGLTLLASLRAPARYTRSGHRSWRPRSCRVAARPRRLLTSVCVEGRKRRPARSRRPRAHQLRHCHCGGGAIASRKLP